MDLIFDLLAIFFLPMAAVTFGNKGQFQPPGRGCEGGLSRHINILHDDGFVPRAGIAKSGATFSGFMNLLLLAASNQYPSSYIFYPYSLSC